MPQALLIDSDILIDHLRKEQSALDYIDQKIDDGFPLFISVISRIEILCGARKGPEKGEIKPSDPFFRYSDFR